MQAYYGPDATTLSGYMDRIKNAQSASPLPGYNQDGLVGDKDLIANATHYANTGTKIPEEDITQSVVRVPTYTIATYISGVQDWITKAGNGAGRDQVITVNISDGMTKAWKDFGFKEVNAGGSGGYWPFFSAEVLYNGKWTTRTLETRTRESSVSIQLSMIGIQKFDVRPGEWDVANIKALFPNRLSGAPEVLSSKYAKIVSVLVGYDVELTVEFGSEMREEVNKIYEEVKSTGGRLSIFGFRVSAEASAKVADRVETEFKDVKWNKDVGSMSLTATKGQVYPAILAAVAQRFD